MNKELLSTGKLYLWVLYYASFILFTLVFLSGFRFLSVGMIFLSMLLVKSYAANKLTMDFVCCYTCKDKLTLYKQYKKQFKVNGTIAGVLLLIDAVFLVHVPEVLKQTYTISALVIFLLVSAYCIVYRWNNYPATFAPETVSYDIEFRKKR